VLSPSKRIFRFVLWEIIIGIVILNIAGVMICIDPACRGSALSLKIILFYIVLTIINGLHYFHNTTIKQKSISNE